MLKNLTTTTKASVCCLYVVLTCWYQWHDSHFFNFTNNKLENLKKENKNKKSNTR